MCFDSLKTVPKISKKSRDEINKRRTCLEKRIPCSCSAGEEHFLIKENLDLSDRKFICRNAINATGKGMNRVGAIIRNVYQISTKPGNSSAEPVDERSTLLEQLSNMRYKESMRYKEKKLLKFVLELEEKIDNCQANLEERINFDKSSTEAKKLLDELNLGPCSDLKLSYNTASLPYCSKSEGKIITVTCEDDGGFWGLVNLVKRFFMFNRSKEKEC